MKKQTKTQHYNSLRTKRLLETLLFLSSLVLSSIPVIWMIVILADDTLWRAFVNGGASLDQKVVSLLSTLLAATVFAISKQKNRVTIISFVLLVNLLIFVVVQLS